MTWLAPWALLGLAAVALPVLVHWLARHQAEPRVFPTIRFLPRMPPTSVRRHRLTDIGLLALRAAIVAAAAAALAQPAWLTPPAPGGRPARAVVVDMSASLQRTLADGRTGIAAAEAAVAALGEDGTAGPQVVVRTGDLRDGLAQAGAWLRAQSGAGEVVVISDFQVGAVTDLDLEAVPVSAGRRFVRIGVDGTVPAPGGAGTVRVYGAPAAEAAARAVTGMFSATGPPAVVIAFAGAAEFDALRAGASPIDAPGLYRLAAQIAGPDVGGLLDASVEVMGTDGPDGPALLLLATLPHDSVEAAALIARALRASSSPAVALAEREPDVLPEEVTARWQRDPRPDLALRQGDPAPYGRWLWALALLLLGVEAWIRRTRPSASGRRQGDVAGPAGPADQEDERRARVA